jgi:hypothetical protein
MVYDGDRGCDPIIDLAVPAQLTIGVAAWVCPPSNAELGESSSP